MAGVVRGVIETLEYSTDYDGVNPELATWTAVPVLQVLSEGLQAFVEEAQLAQTINSLEASAAKKGVAIWPIGHKDTDTFLDALIVAEAELTPTWFRIKPQGQDQRIIGGPTGGLVYVNRNPLPAFGSLVNALVGFSATGAEPGDTFEIIPAGS